jgi:LPXTG-motif cell wall-anchored protein
MTSTSKTADDDTSTTGRRRLPATASPLPLLALAGTLALAGGALLRRRRA